MPHVDFTYTFDADLQGFLPTFPSSGYSGMFWQGADGDPSAGCVEMQNIDSFTNLVYFQDDLKTWEDFGVPAGKYVQCVSLRSASIKQTQGAPINDADVSFGITFLDHSDNTIAGRAGYGYVGTTLDTWSDVVDPTDRITFRGRLSSTPLRIQLDGHLTYTFPGVQVHIRVDTITLRFQYGDVNTGLCSTCDLTVSPSSLTILPGGTQTFTASGTSTPVNWSALHGTIDSSGHYTAPSSGSDTVTATSQADGTCQDSVPVTIESLPYRGVSVPSSHAALIDSGVPVGPGSGSMKARSAGVIAHAALVDHCDSAIEVYLAGAESGDLLSSTAYSAPTVFTLPSTASSGHNYILQLPATDLAKFASGRLGFVKFRYAGGTTRDCAGDLVLGGIEIIYNEKTVT